MAELEEPEAGETEKSVARPVRETICGLSEALSTMTRFPDKLPAAEGVNVTVTEQLPPPVTLAPQLLLALKLLLALIEEIASVPLPLVARVTVCAGLVLPTT